MTIVVITPREISKKSTYSRLKTCTGPTALEGSRAALNTSYREHKRTTVPAHCTVLDIYP